jgi:hypothetical protein
MLDSNPYAWFASRGRRSHVYLTALFLGLCAIWAVFFLLSLDAKTNDFGFFTALMGAFALHVILKGWLALESTRQLSEDRASGALELLLVTPLQARAIMEGEVLALQRRFRLPLALTVGSSLGLIFLMFVPEPSIVSHREAARLVEIVIYGLVILCLDAAAIAYSGMLRGLRARSHHRAVMGTLMRVILPPWIGVVLFFLLIAIPSGIGADTLWYAMRAWFVLCGILDLLLIAAAKRDLSDNLRRIAAGDGPAFGPSPASPRPVAA